MTHDLAGKTILVTGATEGIGKAAAHAFALRGATLVIVGRDAQKTERVRAEIGAASNQANVSALVGDLSLLAGVRSVAAQFRAEHERLDVLVNNAGGVFTRHELTADGIEKTFALNHLGYFYLTELLLDLLEKTPGARIVNTSSGAHNMGKLDLSTVVRRAGKAGFSAYGDSKLANILFTRELARRLASKDVTVNAVHPGWVRSGFALNNSGSATAFFVGLFAPVFARTPEKGAETLVWLATSPDAAQHSGEYFHDRRVAKISKRAQDDALASALWELSEKLCA